MIDGGENGGAGGGGGVGRGAEKRGGGACGCGDGDERGWCCSSRCAVPNGDLAIVPAIISALAFCFSAAALGSCEWYRIIVDADTDDCASTDKDCLEPRAVGYGLVLTGSCGIDGELCGCNFYPEAAYWPPASSDSADHDHDDYIHLFALIASASALLFGLVACAISISGTCRSCTKRSWVLAGAACFASFGCQAASAAFFYDVRCRTARYTYTENGDANGGGCTGGPGFVSCAIAAVLWVLCAMFCSALPTVKQQPPKKRQKAGAAPISTSSPRRSSAVSKIVVTKVVITETILPDGSTHWVRTTTKSDGSTMVETLDGKGDIEQAIESNNAPPGTVGWYYPSSPESSVSSSSFRAKAERAARQSANSNSKTAPGSMESSYYPSSPELSRRASRAAEESNAAAAALRKAGEEWEGQDRVKAERERRLVLESELEEKRNEKKKETERESTETLRMISDLVRMSIVAAPEQAKEDGIDPRSANGDGEGAGGKRRRESSVSRDGGGEGENNTASETEVTIDAAAKPPPPPPPPPPLISAPQASNVAVASVESTEADRAAPPALPDDGGGGKRRRQSLVPGDATGEADVEVGTFGEGATSATATATAVAAGSNRGATAGKATESTFQKLVASADDSSDDGDVVGRLLRQSLSSHDEVYEGEDDPSV